jgi:hypothetical protein
MASAPELIRFVRPPTAFDVLYAVEITQKRQMFERIRMLTDGQIQNQLTELLKMEVGIDNDYWKARAQLSGLETEIGAFETYGVGGKHCAFNNMLIECGLEPNVGT